MVTNHNKMVIYHNRCVDMKENTYRILDILAREIGNPMSINELKNKIQKFHGSADYKNIHTSIHEMEKSRIITTEKIGKSTIAELNFENYLLIVLLSEMELVNKIQFLEDYPEYQLPIQELNSMFKELFFIKSILLIDPKRNAKLNRMELVWIHVAHPSVDADKEMTTIRDFMHKMQHVHNIKIDYLVLPDKKFIELLKMDEANTAKEILSDKIALFNPQTFWMEIKETLSNGIRIKIEEQETHPAKIREIDLVFNLARFGYKEIGTRLYLDAKPIGIEYVVTSILVKKDNIRRLEAIPIILAKNNERINYPLLVFLASKYKVIRQLYSILKVLDALKPSQDVQNIMKEISSTMKQKIKNDQKIIELSLKDMEKKMRLYNVIE